MTDVLGFNLDDVLQALLLAVYWGIGIGVVFSVMWRMIFDPLRQRKFKLF